MVHLTKKKIFSYSSNEVCIGTWFWSVKFELKRPLHNYMGNIRYSFAPTWNQQLNWKYEKYRECFELGFTFSFNFKRLSLGLCASVQNENI